MHSSTENSKRLYKPTSGTMKTMRTETPMATTTLMILPPRTSLPPPMWKHSIQRSRTSASSSAWHGMLMAFEGRQSIARRWCWLDCTTGSCLIKAPVAALCEHEFVVREFSCPYPLYFFLFFVLSCIFMVFMVLFYFLVFSLYVGIASLYVPMHYFVGMPFISLHVLSLSLHSLLFVFDSCPHIEDNMVLSIEIFVSFSYFFFHFSF